MLTVPVILLTLSKAATIAYGEDIPYPPDQWGKFLKPDISTTLVPRGLVEAWESYPSGLFSNRGESFGFVEPQREYVVIGTKAIPYVFSGDGYYLKIVPKCALTETVPGSEISVCDDQTICTHGCWVFQGKEGLSIPENLLGPNYSVRAQPRLDKSE